MTQARGVRRSQAHPVSYLYKLIGRTDGKSTSISKPSQRGTPHGITKRERKRERAGEGERERERERESERRRDTERRRG